MEQCFTLATDYFPEGEVSETTTCRAPPQPSLRRSFVRQRDFSLIQTRSSRVRARILQPRL